MYKPVLSLRMLDNKPDYDYVCLSQDIDFWLEFVGMPESSYDDITGLVVNTCEGELLSVWLTESNRPYDLVSSYYPLPHYKPMGWKNEPNLPDYWLETNPYYSI